MYKFIAIAVFTIIIAGCAGNNSPLVGNIFVNDDNGKKQTVGFYQDSMIFKWNDEMGLDFHTTPYKLTQVDDSTWNIEVVKKHKWMESNTWKIIIDKDGGFHSADSRKKYIKSSGL